MAESFHIFLIIIFIFNILFNSYFLKDYDILLFYIKRDKW